MTNTQKTSSAQRQQRPPSAKKTYDRITFVASDVPEAGAAMRRLAHRYGNAPVAEADAIVALGGDGLMLQTLHAHMNGDTPIYGMNRGSVGFLMNEYAEDNLVERLQEAHINTIHPLSAVAFDQAGREHRSLAINDVALFRERPQAAQLRVSIDGKVRLEELICDGTLIATPAGSTAYNLSANGPILPINAPLLALTPISPFRPRRWRGAILPNDRHISIDVLEPKKRPVSAVADHYETRDVVRVDIALAHNIDILLMYDPNHNLDERILLEQFGG